MSNIKLWSLLLLVPFALCLLGLTWPGIVLLAVIGIADLRRAVQGRRTFSSWVHGLWPSHADRLVLIALTLCALWAWGWHGFLTAWIFAIAGHLFWYDQN